MRHAGQLLLNLKMSMRRCFADVASLLPVFCLVDCFVKLSQGLYGRLEWGNLLSIREQALRPKSCLDGRCALRDLVRERVHRHLDGLP